MKNLLLIVLIIGLGSCISSKRDYSTYKGKYEPGMFGDNPRSHKHKLGMTKVKNRQFDHQTIQKCLYRKGKKSNTIIGR